MPIARTATHFLRRATMTLALAALVVAGVSGCEAVRSTTGDADTRQVTVVGSGSVQGTPDTLTANFGIEFTAPDVTTAMNQTSERAQAVIQALVDAGVERKDISTTNVDVQPQYATVDPNGTSTTGSTGTSGTTSTSGTAGTTATTAVPGTPTIVAFVATNSLSVRIRDTESASQVLAIIVSTGADATRLNSVQYSIDDDSQLVQDARARAFDDAKNRADQYAQLSGLQLGRVISISEAAGAGPSPERAMAADVPLEPGQQTVSFTVTVVWELT